MCLWMPPSPVRGLDPGVCTVRLVRNGERWVPAALTVFRKGIHGVQEVIIGSPLRDLSSQEPGTGC